MTDARRGINQENGVPVTRRVFEQIETVRQSGVVNMLDRSGVLQQLMEHEAYDAFDWVENNRSAYSEAIFRGFAIVEETGDA